MNVFGRGWATECRIAHLNLDQQYSRFLCGEMRFSVARSARSNPLAYRRAVSGHAPSPLALHSPLSSVCLAVSFLVCSSHPRRSLPARFHSSSTASTGAAAVRCFTASCCLFVCLCFAPLRTCVDAIQHPALGGCSACSGRDTRHSHGRAAVRVVLPNTLSVCACIYVCHPLLQQSGVDAMRNYGSRPSTIAKHQHYRRYIVKPAHIDDMRPAPLCSAASI